jgi:hypothetical protein
MRFIQTYLLRLYIDTDVPDQLCGEIRPLETQKTYPFRAPSTLLELLQKLSIPSEDWHRGSSVHSLPNRELEK